MAAWDIQSKKIYEKEYEIFKQWKSQHATSKIDERHFTTYFFTYFLLIFFL